MIPEFRRILVHRAIQFFLTLTCTYFYHQEMVDKRFLHIEGIILDNILWGNRT